MSREKQRIVPMNAHIVKEKHSNAGGRYANPCETADIAAYRCIVIAAVNASEPSGITHRGWIEQIRPRDYEN
jgi:hypothetical protein